MTLHFFVLQISKMERDEGGVKNDTFHITKYEWIYFEDEVLSIHFLY